MIQSDTIKLYQFVSYFYFQIFLFLEYFLLLKFKNRKILKKKILLKYIIILLKILLKNLYKLIQFNSITQYHIFIRKYSSVQFLFKFPERGKVLRKCALSARSQSKAFIHFKNGKFKIMQMKYYNMKTFDAEGLLANYLEYLS